MKITNQRNPLSLTMGSSNNNDTSCNSQLTNYLTGKYFHMVTIGKKASGKSSRLSATVPVISLFHNKGYREQFLAYTANETDPSIVRLRTVLTNDGLRKRNFFLMVEAIGDAAKKNQQKAFEYTSIANTFDNYLKGGERIRYYLGLDGKSKKEPGVVDLTGFYNTIKEYRAKGNQVSSEVEATKQKMA